MNRRSFLTSLAAGSTVAAFGGCAQQNSNKSSSDSLGPTLPTRRLGRTGEQVSMLGVGGYHIGWTTEKDAQETIESAIEGGIRFFDTAEGYGKGESEIRYGKYLTPKFRDNVFLMTKTNSKDAETARQHLEASLSRMKTDYLDLWQIHSLESPENVDQRVEAGLLEVLLKAKEEGKVRYLGFTGHRNPEAHLRMLEKSEALDLFDTCQMPVNVMDPNYHSFVEQVTPVLQRRDIALLAMKTLADGRFFGMKAMPKRGAIWQTENPAIPARISIMDALHFAWALPTSTLITGAENASLIREKIEMAKAFTAMSPEKRLDLVGRVADISDGKAEYYKRPVVS
ncbi:aldo/keto reductase [Pelagicoccus mobilis]|uniref:Aldo/keto reductase n=1 Tax=Pelagicoccus mobilis TaxID=415221 RepID=A0A934S074_9BACT|nr:aldo/keto reductase [Pelagicoccus mobilis]MBK1878775.1 aldo/keto reductase [Pelagicoccus mobilis]